MRIIKGSTYNRLVSYPVALKRLLRLAILHASLRGLILAHNSAVENSIFRRITHSSAANMCVTLRTSATFATSCQTLSCLVCLCPQLSIQCVGCSSRHTCERFWSYDTYRIRLNGMSARPRHIQHTNTRKTHTTTNQKHFASPTPPLPPQPSRRSQNEL